MVARCEMARRVCTSSARCFSNSAGRSPRRSSDQIMAVSSAKGPSRRSFHPAASLRHSCEFRNVVRCVTGVAPRIINRVRDAATRTCIAAAHPRLSPPRPERLSGEAVFRRLAEDGDKRVAGRPRVGARTPERQRLLGIRASPARRIPAGPRRARATDADPAAHRLAPAAPASAPRRRPGRRSLQLEADRDGQKHRIPVCRSTSLACSATGGPHPAPPGPASAPTG